MVSLSGPTVGPLSVDKGTLNPLLLLAESRRVVVRDRNLLGVALQLPLYFVFPRPLSIGKSLEKLGQVLLLA